MLSPFPLLLLGLALAPAATPSDWPAFRGKDGQAISLDRGLPTEWNATTNIVWKTDLPGAGSSTPIVFGDRVYITCYTGYNVPGQPRGKQEDLKLHLLCLDRASGKIRWIRDVEPKLPEQETIRDGHGYATSTPVADTSGVYVFFGKTGVFAFDTDGKMRWQADVGSGLNGWGTAASLLLDGDRLIVNASVESETLYALDTRTGKVVWQLGGIKESWNTPIRVTHAGKTELVLAIFGKILGIDPTTGKQRWSCATDIPWYMVPSLVAHDGIVYAIGGRPGGGLAVRVGGSGDVTKTHRLWAINKGGNVSSPVYHQGHLYWMHDNTGTAFCAKADTGAIVYQERLDRVGQVYGSPVLVEGRIYYPCRNGVALVVAAEPTFRRLAANSLGERGEWNSSLAVAGGRFFLRTNRAIYCIGTK